MIPKRGRITISISFREAGNAGGARNIQDNSQRLLIVLLGQAVIGLMLMFPIFSGVTFDAQSKLHDPLCTAAPADAFGRHIASTLSVFVWSLLPRTR